jgi:hypothetical protein
MSKIKQSPVAPSRPSAPNRRLPSPFTRAVPLREGPASASSKDSFLGGRVGRVIRRARKNPKTGEWEEIDDRGNLLPKKNKPPNNPNSTSILPGDTRWKNASGKRSAQSPKKNRVRLPAIVPPSKRAKVAPSGPAKAPQANPPRPPPAGQASGKPARRSNPVINLPNLPKKKGKVVIGGNSKQSAPTPKGSDPAKRDTIPARPSAKNKSPGSTPKAKDGKKDGGDSDPWAFLDEDEDYAWEQGLPALQTASHNRGSGEPTRIPAQRISG